MFLPILIGALSGVVAALCGVGGGVIMVPLFVGVLGLSQKQAVATSLAAIVLTSVAASAKNAGNDLVDWKVAIPAGIAGSIIAWISAGALQHFQNRTLTLIFASVMIVVGIRMLFVK